LIGKIRRVPLREVWKHEAIDFTRWLEENIDVLNEILDFSLSNAERERSTGNFNVDLIAQDESGNTVIIENQLEKSDHDHLGKVITYLAAVGAKKAIWITPEPRPEHIGAIKWLNESNSDASFYLLKVEAICVGDSPPAPLLTLIVGPSEEGKEIRETKEDLAEGRKTRKRFWAQLLVKAKTRTRLHAAISPVENGWISTGAGLSGLAYSYVIRRHEASVELYIDRGKEAEEENRSIFEALLANKGAIEKEFGEPLDWQPLEGKRACRIEKEIPIGGFDDDGKWPEIQDAMVDAMVRLERALKPYISKLDV